MRFFAEFMDQLKKFGLEFFSRYYSFYPGIVVDNADPEKRGRVKVELPSILGPGKIHGTWAEPVDMRLSGSGTGEFFPPYVGQMVQVMFEHGDLNYPCYKGGHYSKNELPQAFLDGYPNVRGFVFKSGQTILVDENEGQQKIVIKNPSGSQVVIDDTSGKETASLIHKLGSKIYMDENGAVIMQSKSGCTIKEADDGSITISDAGVDSLEFKDGNINGVAKQLFKMIAKQFVLGGSAYSAILGENQQAFNDSHTHISALPGQPTSPAVPPSSAKAGTPLDIMALKVKLIGNMG